MRWLDALGHALAITGSMTWEITVGADPRVRAVRRGAGRRAPLDDRPAARRRPAPDAGDRDRARGRLVVVLLRRGGAGPVAVPQGRELHRRDGVRDRLHQPGHRARHHPGAADGLAVHPGRVHRRPAHDRAAGGAVPAVPAPAGCSARRGRQADQGLAGSMEGHAAMDMSVKRRGQHLAAAAVPAGLHLGLAHLRDGVGRGHPRHRRSGCSIAGAVAAWVPDSFWQPLVPHRPPAGRPSSGGR